jgi:toluene monooxygenase system protein E
VTNGAAGRPSPRELRAARAVSPTRRTYWCLEGSRKKPTDYEVTSTALLYYPSRGFEVETPVWRHYVEHQRGSRLRSTRWDSFEDPAHTTYSSYVAERRDQEAFLDRLLERPAGNLTRELRPLLGLLSALRFALHGQQMVAAYVGALAPSGRVSIAAAFQAADELRRIQRICQWLWRSGVPVPQLDALGRELWQQAPALQPWRRLVEQLLVTYDFGLALVGLNGVIKPVFDRLWLDQLAGVAERHHDEVLEKILGSLADDGRWHEMWFIKLAQTLIEDDPGNSEVMKEHVAQLRPQVTQAAHALLTQFEGLLGDEGEQAYVRRELDLALDAHLRQLGLGAEQGEDSLEERT